MKRERASILIFTLWVLIILAIFSVILSRRASMDLSLARRESRNIKATYLARAGTMKMLAELAKDTNAFDSLNEDWNRTKDNPQKLILRKNTILYGASDEMARLNLNSPDLKVGYLVGLGVGRSITEGIVKYRNSKKDRKFEFIEELFLVKGMTHECYSTIKDSITIYRGDNSKININTASEKVLKAIIGNAGLVQDILDYRKGPDGKEGTPDDGIFTNSSDINMKIQGLDPTLFTVKSDIFRIWAQSFLFEDKQVLKTIEAIVDRKSGKFYYWKEY